MHVSNFSLFLNLSGNYNAENLILSLNVTPIVLKRDETENVCMLVRVGCPISVHNHELATKMADSPACR